MTETNQNEAGDSPKPEASQANTLETEAKEVVETVKEEAKNDLKTEFTFVEPTVLKGKVFLIFRFKTFFTVIQTFLKRLLANERISKPIFFANFLLCLFTFILTVKTELEKFRQNINF